MMRRYFFSVLILGLLVMTLVQESNSLGGDVEYLPLGEAWQPGDTLKLYTLEEGRWKESFMFFDHNITRKDALVKTDTISMRLSTGGLYGYVLDVEIIDGRFVFDAIKYSCGRAKQLSVTQGKLGVEDYELIDGAHLKGQIYCEATGGEKEEKIKIEGGFMRKLIIDVRPNSNSTK